MRFVSVLVAGLLTMTAAMAVTYKGYETPPYVVISSQGAIELRAYSGHLLAEVQVSGTRSTAVSRGFRVLAGYIFGGNAEGTKIAMTTPVGQTPKTEAQETWTISFMMPKAFTRDTLPTAETSSIAFTQTPPERQLVLTFSGMRGDRVLAKHAATLAAHAKTQGHEVTGPPRYYFYDGPMTAPWNRRNEVALPIR